ncbi:MAG TPA: malectin domain-containing carbohydrate-binding protein, partial [Verrucomicrobiae bacterium]|nr:malectin domain-containing carbohydrate-binding protein [Verrucomicrobiae bacterium]
VGGYAALTKTINTTVSDASLEILFTHVTENPKVAGIEIHKLPTAVPPPPPPPASSTVRINVGGPSFVDPSNNTWSADNYFNNVGSTFQVNNPISNTTNDTAYQSERWDPQLSPELAYHIPVVNGDYEIRLHFAEIYTGTMNVGARVFDVFLENALVVDNLDIFSEVGGYAALVRTFNTTISDGFVDISLGHVTENPKLSGIEIIPSTQPSQHFAHAVAGNDQAIIDTDNSGSEQVNLDGSFSHTHAVGETIISYVWTIDSAVVANGVQSTITLPIGTHNITLNVTDSANNSATDDMVVTVSAPAGLPGLAGYYYDYSDVSLNSIPNMSLRKPSFAQLEPNINYVSTGGAFGNAPYTDKFAVRYQGQINIPVNGTYTFGLQSDDGSRLFIDNQLVVNNDGLHGMQKQTGNITLTAGPHDLLVEYFENLGGAGVILSWTKPSTPEETIPATALTHTFNELLPVIHDISPTGGSGAGGNTVTINGFGFVYGSGQTVVNFGNSILSGTAVNMVNSSTISVTAPPGTGTAQISVVTPNDISNNKPYLFNALPPVQFSENLLLSGINGPTTLTFGPDGKLYVGTQFGEVWILTLDQNKNIINTVVSTAIPDNETTFRTILGIAFNPLDDPANPKLYVSHSHLFHGEAVNFYNGKVSTLSGLNLSVKQDLITGLPVSDHDHGINGLEFDNDGNLFIQVGGNTNAGVPGAMSSTGIQDEGFFSAATLKANINNPSFNGDITYDAQGYPVSSTDIEVFAAGFRNPFDLVQHTNGLLYGTDNGPNFNFGPKSVTCSTQGPDPEEDDELNILVNGGYYGHANRKRGALDPRQCTWRSKFEPSDAQYTAPIADFPASTNGITEYWTNNFAGQLRGDLFLSRWIGELFQVKLSGDGSAVTNQSVFSPNGGLDVTVAPDGSIFLARHNTNEIKYFAPVENSPGLDIVSVFPRRGPASGNRTVTLTGRNINPSSQTTVQFGGVNCPVLALTAKTITCTLPASSPGFVNVVVSNGSATNLLQNGFLYMNQQTPPPPPANPWTAKQPLLEQLGEVAAASTGGYVYVFSGHESSGQNNDLYRYDPQANTWLELAEQNIIPAADHVAAQAINGKIYIFGGCVAGGESNSLAVYDPVLNTWEQKAGLIRNGQPYGICSASSAEINGMFYIAGGIHSNATINLTFVYDPTTDTWTELAPMPAARNHAAGASMNGKFYIFGGRCCGGNVSGAGNPQTFVYDPQTNVWTQGANLPTPRGGMGSGAVVGAEIFVIGGEGGGPFNGTFNTVEAYNPIANTWRTLSPMPTARHGIFPVTLNNRIHVVAGGVTEGHSLSNIHEVMDPTISSPTTIRINTGGSSFIDPSGNSWSSDTYYNTGNTFSISNPIANTTNDTLYQSERWDPNPAPELTYTIQVPNGNYEIILHFSEIYTGAMHNGARVFDVSVENSLALDNLDIYSEVGGYAALTKTINTTVSDASLEILFTHVTENPKVAGIEIIPR